MNNLNEYKKRFYNLMESTLGDVKPLIMENKGFCLTKFKDTSLPSYKNCMFEGVTPQTFGNYVDRNGSDGHIYPKNGQTTDYTGGKSAYFIDSSGKKVYMIETGVFDTGGVAGFLDDPILITILDYMVANKYITKYNKDLPSQTLRELPSNISKRGSMGQFIVTLPSPPKNATGPSPITNFTYWPKAHIYYYDRNKPTDFIFTDEGVIDQTFLTLIQNRK
jgi:hypothetical protein